jgi:hypothetical protein
MVDPWHTVTTPFTAAGVVVNDAVCDQPTVLIAIINTPNWANRFENRRRTFIYGQFLQ